MVAKPGYFCGVKKTFTLDEINETATMLWKWAEKARVLAFHGAMGTGKTTLIHALCNVIHVKDVVGSPTFSIINEYVYTSDSIEKKIYHIDLYRLKDVQEALLAGVEECLYSGNKCLVEWPEKAASLLPPDTLHIYMESVDDQTRLLQIKKN
ncbi:MAG TPA: tRNA (adenosine(37)-N6)-threonylcarbamoyltransferase complex ATPase subunit type 1 TsaE [Chitinophagaceae bacterium]|nr:tRNA (adenosine(37)-N6)-threonylcarbamoyltransferase complex ATPase subunit type 1 TsaE [Chitinophagaceae bacterium]